MQDVFLLLGSNLGNRQKNLLKARDLITAHICEIKSCSSIYQTSAWGKTNQPDFINQAVFLQTNLSPSELLKRILRIEEILDRKRTEKWGSRTIDIDILFFGTEVINELDLTIPHALLHKRRFVLVPLNEIAPNLIHPVLNKSIDQLLNDLTDILAVKKLQNKY